MPPRSLHFGEAILSTREETKGRRTWLMDDRSLDILSKVYLCTNLFCHLHLAFSSQPPGMQRGIPFVQDATQPLGASKQSKKTRVS